MFVVPTSDLTAFHLGCASPANHFFPRWFNIRQQLSLRWWKMTIKTTVTAREEKETTWSFVMAAAITGAAFVKNVPPQTVLGLLNFSHLRGIIISLLARL